MNNSNSFGGFQDNARPGSTLGQRRGNVDRSPGKQSMGGQGSSQMANSFIGRSRGGRGGGGGRDFQPRIDGDYMSGADDDRSLQGGAQGFRGGRNQYNSNSNQRRPYGDRPPTGDQYGAASRFDGGAGRAPGSSGGDFKMNNSFAGRRGGANAQNNRQGTGMSMTSGPQRSGRGGGFARGGRGGGGRGGGMDAYQDRAGGGNMQRYGSQMSLQNSQNSYGEQQQRQGLSRVSSNQRFGGTIGASRGGRSGFGRQNSSNNVFGGDGGYGRSFATQQRSSAQLFNPNLDDQDLQYIVGQMAQSINKASHEINLANPAHFFKNYDAFPNRSFEPWELQILFQLQQEEIDYVFQVLDTEQQGALPIGHLFECLYQQVHSLNIKLIRQAEQSVWVEKKKQMFNKQELQSFETLASWIIKQSTGRSYKNYFYDLNGRVFQNLDQYQQDEFWTMNQDYIGEFQGIQMQDPYDDQYPIMEAQSLTDDIQSQIEPRLISKFLDYICLGRGNDKIFVVHFVRAMQILSPDSQTRQVSPSPDLTDMSRSRYNQSIDEGPGNLEKKLLSLSEQPSSANKNSTVVKIANFLEENDQLSKISSLEVYMKHLNGEIEEVECTTKTEFETFLKNLKVTEQNPQGKPKEKPLLDTAEVSAIINLYAGQHGLGLNRSGSLASEMPVTKEVVGIAQAQAALVKEATPEEEQDQPADTSQLGPNQEEIKVEEQPLGGQGSKDEIAGESPFKQHNDTDDLNERDLSMENPLGTGGVSANLAVAANAAEDKKVQEPLIVDQSAQQEEQKEPKTAAKEQAIAKPSKIEEEKKAEPKKVEEEKKVEPKKVEEEKKDAAPEVKPAQKTKGELLSTVEGAKGELPKVGQELEQLEGGEPEEYYEGGDGEWINLKKFKEDIQEITKLTRTKARNLIFEIFERIKKWYTLKVRSIKTLFKGKLKGKKDNKIVDLNDLRWVLNRVVKPFRLKDIHLNAILQVLGDGTQMNYEHFTNAYFEYSNTKKVSYNNDQHGIREIMDTVKEYQGPNGSLVDLLASKEAAENTTKPNFKYEVQFKTFIQKIKKHHGKTYHIESTQEKKLEELVVPDKISGMADLIKIQELVGFPEVELFDVQDQVYRRLAMALQMKMLTVEQMREYCIGGNRARKKMKKMELASNWFQNIIGVDPNDVGEVEWNEMQGMMQEFDNGEGENVDTERFLGRIEREMNKFAMVLRFFLQLMKIQDGGKKRMEIEWDEIHSYLTQRGLTESDGSIDLEIAKQDFRKLLYGLDLVDSEKNQDEDEKDQDESWIYFEEYFFEHEDTVSDKALGEAFEQISEHIENVVSLVFQNIDDYCRMNEYAKKSLNDELVNMQRTNQIIMPGEAQKNSIQWLHTFDFLSWYQTYVIPGVLGQENAKYDREVTNIFITYMSRSIEQKNLIFMPFLLQRYIRNNYDSHVEQQLAQDSMPILVRHICKVLDQQNIRPKEYFRSPSYGRNSSLTRDDQFLQILNGSPFNTENDVEFPVSLSLVIRHSQDIREPRQGQGVNIKKFKNLLKAHIDKLTIRTQEFLNIRKGLDEKGMTVEQSLTYIKNTPDKMKDVSIEVVDLIQLIDYSGYRMEKGQEKLIAIMETFDKSIYGEIAALDVIHAFKNAHIGLFEDTDEVDAQATVTAKRYFTNLPDVLYEICAEIDDRNITDFGLTLKDNDMFHEGKISNSSFFQTLMQMFGETLGEGDVLDIIKYFDPQSTGAIALNQIKRVFNRKIRNRECRIVLPLVSWIDACIEEQIVEPLSPRSKAAKQDEEDSIGPEHYRKQMLLDIFCGSIVKSEGDLRSWFQKYTSGGQDELNQNEFVMALDHMGVETDLREKENVFGYLAKKIAIQMDKLMEFKKMPVHTQTILIDHLIFILNEDMPENSIDIIENQLVKRVAFQVTEQKIPVLDYIKVHEDQPGYIDQNTFASNLLQNDFKLKQSMTKNMISVVAKRYDQYCDGENRFPVDKFLADLELQQLSNQTQIRIFKTQEEINFFQRNVGEGGLEGSFAINKIIHEPIREPVYEALSHKNTHYKPDAEEYRSDFDNSQQMNYSGNMGGDIAVNSFERTQTPIKEQEKPMLDASYIGYIDELIIQTRKIGVSIEGYFQRFGKFSTQDGIRKVDINQFKEAIVNLDGMENVSANPELIDYMFNAILQAFETIERGKRFDNTILSNNSYDRNSRHSSPDKEQFDKDRVIEKLRLDQLGQLVYYNSSVDMLKEEALALQQLHEILFEVGLLDKLPDMVNFMNWNRDSSCSVDQFHRLLRDTMQIGEKIDKDQIKMLLQRYRQDGYQVARLQGKDLFGLNKNHKEIIERGFQNVGKQRIQLLGLYHDLGYQQRKIGLKDQWMSKIAEDIVKGYQVKLYDGSEQPMNDSNVDHMMRDYFIRMCREQSHDSTFTFLDLKSILISMDLWDNQELHSKKNFQDFFKICFRYQDLDQNYFKPNSIDPSTLGIQAYIDTSNFIKSFLFCSKKPLDIMYQEILDKFYIISKRQNISINGPVLMHLFDQDDKKNAEEVVSAEIFVYRIQEFLERKPQKGHTLIKDTISEHDLKFLATKYTQRDTYQGCFMVKYFDFIGDYDQIEKNGLGGGLNQLSFNSFNRKRKISTSLKSSAGGIKRIEDVTPPESQQLYKKMGNYLSKNGLIDELCFSLINQDPNRDGYLDRNVIGQVVAKNGMKMSSKQLGLLTQVLITNHKQEMCYLEMIALLVNHDKMNQLIREQNLEFGGPVAEKKLDMNMLTMSQELRDQVELKLSQLKAKVSQMTRGTQLIRDQELFRILKDADIGFGLEDLEMLESYLDFSRNQENNTISFHDFLQDFDISPETSIMLTDIVEQLSKKSIVIQEVTSTKRFSFEQFRELLTRVGVKIDNIPTLQCLFDQMSEREEDLERVRMIRCFGVDYTNVSQDHKAKPRRSTKRDLPEPPIAVNALLAFFVNNKINLMEIFANQIESNLIKIQQLKQLCAQNRYPVHKGDMEIIIQFFKTSKAKQQDQENKKQDSGRRRTTVRGRQQEPPNSNSSRGPDNNSDTSLSDDLNLSKIIAYLKRIDPNYGKNMENDADSGSMITSFPKRIKLIMKKFSDYMFDNQLAKESLFDQLDSNNDGRISQAELIQFANKNQMIEGLSASDIEILFTYLDINQDGNISIHEFCLLVSGIVLSLKARIKSFSFEFNAKLKSEIEDLFDELDNDRNGALTANELVQMIRPTDKSGQVTLEKAASIIRQFDTNGDGRISKPEFVDYLMERQKRQILDFEDQMEDLRRLFKEQIEEGVAADPSDPSDIMSSNQFITKNGLKNLIVKSGHKEVTQQEIDAIFLEMDDDKNGTIDIDEFMAFINVADKVKAKNIEARDAVFNIRKARLKLNSLDLLQMFQRMPLSFLPSFSQREVEQRKKNLPIHGIQFHFNHQSISYSGLEKIQDLRQKNDQPRLYVAQHKPKVGLQIALTGESAGDVFNVPLIQRLKQNYELPHFEVRIVLFDMATKVYLSNFYILGAEVVRQQPNKNQNAPDEGQMSANLRYDSNLSQFYLASDELENMNASLVFEFVIYSNNFAANNAKEKRDKGNQVTVAWTHIAVSKLQNTVKHKIDLLGGNPFQPQELSSTDVDGESEQKQEQSKSFIKKIFGGGSAKNAQVQRYLKLESKPFTKLPELVQVELSSLPYSPQSCLICKPLLSLAVTFRYHSFLLLTKHEQEMTKPNLDLTMVQFPKIYNSPDFQSALASCWPHALLQHKNLGVLAEEKRLLMIEFVRQIYSVMFDYNIKLDQVYPTRSSPLFQSLYNARQLTLKKNLMAQNQAFLQKTMQEATKANQQAAASNEAEIAIIAEPADGQTLFMEDYVPFGMGEICGNLNGFDGNDAVAGLQVDQEQTVDEMERKYAAQGLYI